MLDGLVRGAVLAQADRVVRHHEQRARVAQRRHADGRPHVVCAHNSTTPVLLQCFTSFGPSSPRRIECVSCVITNSVQAWLSAAMRIAARM